MTAREYDIEEEISDIWERKNLYKFMNYSFCAETISKQLIIKVIIHTSSSRNVP